jgi:hypothetical protein
MAPRRHFHEKHIDEHPHLAFESEAKNDDTD